jgi:NAD/NADP transhydrogenase beta subunit
VAAAVRVKMTGMPEMVALFNGFGGLASLLVGAAEYVKLRDGGISLYLTLSGAERRHRARWFVVVAIGLTVLIGGVTFTGSLIAYGQARRQDFGETHALSRASSSSTSLLASSPRSPVVVFMSLGIDNNMAVVSGRHRCSWFSPLFSACS